ncbi:alpha/beta fold hydrolase [Kordiimonas marina]|uniref:alpha/beta fold hydrolase n=1 Tax=Kordiimonas marina TaxID=2872312 RepID=UPI001FF281B9|nr:alpha/beta hydrolase [Kordiimonas marina]
MLELALKDGGHMAYQDTGEKPDGLTFLLLHGWVTGAAFFDKQIKALGAAHRVIVPDLRGHGASSPLPEDGNLTTLASDVAALVEALDLKNIIIVGWSMGATVAWLYLQRHGADRIAGLVIEDMTPKVVNEDGWTHGARGTLDRVSALSMFERPMASLSKSLVRMSLAREDSPAAGEVETYAAKAEVNDRTSMKVLWIDLLDQDLRRFMQAAPVPMLLASGARSQLYGPALEAWYHENVPGVRVVSFATSGHAPHLEQPEEFNSTIVEFGLSLRPAS